MIIAGLKLTFLGMGVVILFLLLLMLLMHVCYKLMASVSERELARIETAEQQRRKKASARATQDDVLVAIITAAIAAHRART